MARLIADKFKEWDAACNARFQRLRSNEETLNALFIDMYRLQNELTPAVADKDISVRKADVEREIKSLLSYAVGCLFGRYSHHTDGLLFAGGDWQATIARLSETDDAFLPVADNILTLSDVSCFENDLTQSVFRWIEAVYGKETLENNLRFIADALGGKGTSRDVIHRYLLRRFYPDHVKTYQNRPIYWLFSSGKHRGFQALIYVHRYHPDLLSHLYAAYVCPHQEHLRGRLAELERARHSASSDEKIKLKKNMEKCRAQIDEVDIFAQKLHRLAGQSVVLNPDDGIAANYAVFGDVLETI